MTAPPAPRKGEALNLRWDEVDEEAGVGRVHPHKGKGLILPWVPKGADARDVPLEPQATDWAREAGARSMERVAEAG